MIIRFVPILRKSAVTALVAGLMAGQISVGQDETAAQPNGANLVDPGVTGVETAILAQAPNVPPPITRKQPAKVIVNLEVREVTKRLADGVEYVFLDLWRQCAGKFYSHPRR